MTASLSASVTGLVSTSFVCAECGKSFRRRYDMQRHSVLHSTNPETYSCTFPGCKYTTLQKSNVKTHYLSQHMKQNRFKCLLGCSDFYFPSPGGLKSHEKKYHGVNDHHSFESRRLQSMKQTSKLKNYAISSHARDSSNIPSPTGSTMTLTSQAPSSKESSMPPTPGASESDFFDEARTRTVVNSTSASCDTQKNEWETLYSLHKLLPEVYPLSAVGDWQNRRAPNLFSHLSHRHHPYNCPPAGNWREPAFKSESKTAMLKPVHAQLPELDLLGTYMPFEDAPGLESLFADNSLNLFDSGVFSSSS